MDRHGDIVAVGPTALVKAHDVTALAEQGWQVVGPGRVIDASPRATGVVRLGSIIESAGPVDLALWEPAYGRVAEAQRRWEVAHGRSLSGA